MTRRAFITLLGGAAAAWPLAARAQQPGGRMRRIGVLTGFSEDDREAQRRVTAFLGRLRELGWTDGRNVRIDYRWGAGDASRIRAYAAELVRLAPDVILVNSSSVLRPLQQESSSIPIVFVQINDKLKLSRLLDGNVRRLCALKNFVDELRCAPKELPTIRSVRQQSTRFHKFPICVNDGKPELCSKVGDLPAKTK